MRGYILAVAIGLAPVAAHAESTAHRRERLAKEYAAGLAACRGDRACADSMFREQRQFNADMPVHNAPPVAGRALSVQEGSAALDDGMTFDQVHAALRRRPNQVEQETCGGETAAVWQCRIETYSDGEHQLFVFYNELSGGWRVNNWLVRP